MIRLKEGHETIEIKLRGKPANHVLKIGIENEFGCLKNQKKKLKQDKHKNQK